MKTMTTPVLVRCNGDWVVPRHDTEGTRIFLSISERMFCIDLMTEVIPSTGRADTIRVHMRSEEPATLKGWYLLDHNPFEDNEIPEEKYVVQSMLHPQRVHYVPYFYEGAMKYIHDMGLPLYFHVEIFEGEEHE